MVAPVQYLIFFSFCVQHRLPWVHQTSCSYISRSISPYSVEHAGMKSVFEIVEAVTSLLGRFTVIPIPVSVSSQPWSELTYTNSHTRDQTRTGSFNYSMTKPHDLCARMHTRIDDICLGICKQWQTHYWSSISNGDIDMHENLYKSVK